MLTYAKNQPEAESFWEKVEDKLIEYAYTMAERRTFIDYLFIPGVGGGKQELGAGELYAVILLLPSIGGQKPTTDLLKNIVEEAFKEVYTTFLSGDKNLWDIKNVMKKFLGTLSGSLEKGMKSCAENIVSFYLPYQRMMFRVVAFIWIKSDNLVGTLADAVRKGIKATLTGVTEEIVGSAYHFLYALCKGKLNDLMENINLTIDTYINELKSEIDTDARFLKEVTSGKISYTENIGDTTITLYMVWAREEPDTTYVFGKISEKMNIAGNLEKYYKNAEEIISEYKNMATENMKNSGMYQKLFEKLKESLTNKMAEILGNPNIITKINGASAYYLRMGLSSEKEADEILEELKETVKNECKENLKKALEDIKNEYLKGPISKYLTDINTTLSSDLEEVLGKAKEIGDMIAKEAAGIISDAANDAITKIPVIGSIYGIANAIHQVFVNTITDFEYTVTPPEDAIVEEDGNIKYYKDSKYYGKEKPVSVPGGLLTWSQGCVKGIMAGLIGMISSEASEALNYLPQVFVFDMDFGEMKIFTQGKPGFYLINGKLRFNNLYNRVGQFIGNVIGGFIQLKDKNGKYVDNSFSVRKSDNNFRYSIFGEVIENELKEHSPSESGEKNTELRFTIPYIVGSTIPVLANVEEIDEYSLNFRMASILDLGSLVKPTIQEIRNELKEKAKSLADKLKGIVDELINKIGIFLEETFNNAVDTFLNELGEDEESILWNIVTSITKEIINHVKKKLIETIINQIRNEVEKLITRVLQQVFETIDIASEKMEDIISITLSGIAIPARGMEKKISIIIPSMSISKSVDNLGYCKISISKSSLIMFSAPVSGVGSYVAFTDEGSICMIPYSTHSYEPFIVQVFSEISPQSNTFRVKWISDPKKDLQGVSIETREMSDGTKLVLLRDSSQAQAESMKLMYIPNPYPYAEAYVSLKIAE